MVLIFEIIGAIVVAFGLQAVLRPTGHQPVALVAVIGVVVAAVTFWSGLWPQMSSLVTTHDADAKVSLADSNAAGGAANFGGVNEPFMQFVTAHVPAGARVFMECGQHQMTCGSEADWFGFRLTPRVFVAKPDLAQWTIFYDANPALDAFAKRWKITTFANDFAIAKAPR